MKTCDKCKKNEIREDQKICYNCFKNWKNLRLISRNEIVLDCDNKEFGDLGIKQVGLMMSIKGYKLEVWNHGGKSYHIHIKDIPHISKLSDKSNKLYKELITKRYIAEAKCYVGNKHYFKDFDFSVCRINNLIAEENKPHHRSKKVKKLIGIINEDLENKCEEDIYQIVEEQEVKEYKPKVKGSGITSKIIERISIVDVAKRFGLEVDSRGFTCCPFHNDSDPSLKFYDNQGRFMCFGCLTEGNIIMFYALMKKLKQKELKQ